MISPEPTVANNITDVTNAEFFVGSLLDNQFLSSDNSNEDPSRSLVVVN